MRPLLKSVLVLLGSLLLPTVSWAQQMGGGTFWGPHMMWGEGWTGGFFMIVFWVLVIVVIFLAVRWKGSAGGFPGTGRSESALDVLKRRYASGEIDRDTFMEMKKDLEN